MGTNNNEKESVTIIKEVFIKRKALSRVDFSLNNLVRSDKPALIIKSSDRPTSSKKLFGQGYNVDTNSKIQIEECIYGGWRHTAVDERDTNLCRLIEIDMNGVNKPRNINKIIAFNSYEKGIIVVNRASLDNLGKVIFGGEISAMLVTREKIKR